MRVAPGKIFPGEAKFALHPDINMAVSAFVFIVFILLFFPALLPLLPLLLMRTRLLLFLNRVNPDYILEPFHCHLILRPALLR